MLSNVIDNQSFKQNEGLNKNSDVFLEGVSLQVVCGMINDAPQALAAAASALDALGLAGTVSSALSTGASVADGLSVGISALDGAGTALSIIAC